MSSSTIAWIGVPRPQRDVGIQQSRFPDAAAAPPSVAAVPREAGGRAQRFTHRTIARPWLSPAGRAGVVLKGVG
ncbi:hypothetical protein [Streptomyces sp. WZ-12]|uniref:hypothetical protein n=1 Tax=Streptomyces sp. WZ-12 TaxID=3030210 RepID=UPI002380EB1F|nr:hypothetical protein [Streptomyces sp. WZ-12]